MNMKYWWNDDWGWGVKPKYLAHQVNCAVEKAWKALHFTIMVVVIVVF
jgi:hypothetical protein